MARAMLIESNTPQKFWPEAIAASVYLTNRLPSSTLNLQTPLEVLSALAQIPLPLTLQPRVFGCLVFVHIPKHERTKLSPCAVKCVFVGYEASQKGYRCFDPKSNHMFTTMSCDFLETDYFFNQLSSQGERDNDLLSRLDSSVAGPPEEVIKAPTQSSEIQPTPISDTSQENPLPISTVSTSDTSLVHNDDDVPIAVETDPETDIESESGNQTESEVCDLLEEQVSEGVGGYTLPPRENRGVPPKRYSPEVIGKKAKYSIANMAKGQLSEMAHAFEAELYEEEEIPCTIEEAWRHKHWREAMLKEMGALERNDTWVKCKIPDGKKAVGCNACSLSNVDQTVPLKDTRHGWWQRDILKPME